MSHLVFYIYAPHVLGHFPACKCVLYVLFFPRMATSISQGLRPLLCHPRKIVMCVNRHLPQTTILNICWMSNPVFESLGVKSSFTSDPVAWHFDGLYGRYLLAEGFMLLEPCISAAAVTLTRLVW